MANQTLTTGTPAARVNYDSATLNGLLNGETITINGGHMLIDADVRWANNAAIFDSITISATLGGSVLIDGTQVWEVPFSASTGNVPAAAVVGSNAVTGAGITGELIAVWATGALAPTAAAAAMPATGWIKLRSKTGNFNGVVVTLPGGATVTCSGDGKRSWIHVVGEEAGTVTVPRLGTFTITGDWYELGTTNGADDQTFQFPVADNCPAIQVETAAGSGVYEWWLNGGSRWGAATLYISQDVRGKYFGMDNATGIITIARRATNACGYKPPTGCKVRIPNVICSNTTSANFAANTINATLATRYDFTTTSAGVVNIDKASCNWYLSLTNAFEANITNSGILQSVLFSNIAAVMKVSDCAIGLNSTTEFTPIAITNCFTGVELLRNRAARYAASAANQYVCSATDVANYVETDCQWEMFGSTTAVTRGNASVYSTFLSRCVGTNVITRNTSIGCGMQISSSANVTVDDTRYADCHIGSTTTTNGISAIGIYNGSNGVYVKGFSSFADLANVHPYGNIVAAGTGVQNLDVRNIGTAAAPYNCGSANATGTPISISVALNVRLQRIYTQNVRTSVVSTTNTAQNVLLESVWGDAGDIQHLAAVNCVAKGCRWTHGTTGQASVYARHWEDNFTGTTTGRILIAMNEPLAATTDQCAITAGTPQFTSGGQVSMPTVGDQVTWTMPYFALGHTSLTNVAPSLYGTNTGNFSYEFQYDKTGAGFNGTWLALTGANLNGIGAINPAVGVRLMVRATTTVANTTNALTYLAVSTTTDATSQQQQYPLDLASISLTTLVAGSRVQLYDTTNSVELFNDVVAGTSLTYAAAYTADFNCRVRVMYQSGVSAYKIEEFVLPVTIDGASRAVTQTVDAIYNANAIDGSGITGIVIDDAGLRVRIDTGSLTWQQIYAYETYWLMTEEGIRDESRFIEAPDQANYILHDFKIINEITPAGPLVISGGLGVDGVTGDAIDVIDTSGGTIFCVPNVVIPFATGGGGGGDTKEDIYTYFTSSGRQNTFRADTAGLATAAAVAAIPTNPLLTTDARLNNLDATVSSRLATAGYTAPPAAATVAAEVLSQAAAAPISAEVKSINGVILAGSGTAIDPMRPA